MTPDEFERAFVGNVHLIKRYVVPRIPKELQGRLSPEDIVQDVWILSSAGVERFKAETDDAFSRWIIRIAKNAFLDRIKSHSRGKRSGLYRHFQAGAARTSLRGLFELAASSERSPSLSARIQESVRLLDAALMTIAENRRTAIRMRYIDELPTETIATYMKCSPSAVRGLIAEGLKDLRKSMDFSAVYEAL